MNPALETRIRRLERGARRWRAATLLLACACALVLVARPLTAEPEAPPKLRVGGLELVDDAGHVRARLGVDGDGKAAFTVFGEKLSNPRATLTVGKQGAPALVLRNDQGMAQFIASLGKTGPALVLLDREGSTGTSLTMRNDDGTSLLGMRLPGEKTLRAVLTVMEDGAPYLKLHGPEGELRIFARPQIEFREGDK